ncbi:hypothetical protein [Actinomadura rayongensis]|uniref:Lipoprotein n=1 Tax=Actinomadura rayongensis TaxID=1429076 RepID=A0A6I4W6X3_9ACTN|nr:hypothetical protein [Actinomadura rayongensis]MXQ65261.1 hypothetical protein [Actinomadura rayongensis]
MSNYVVRLGGGALALAAVFALSACKDGAKTDDVTSGPQGGTPTVSSVPSTPSVRPSAPSPTSVPRTVDAAIARYLTAVRALGTGDLTTLCAIAGPAAKRAEVQGFGKCRTTFAITRSMFSDAQLAALQTATVNKAMVTRRANGDVDVPARAVVAATRFTARDLSDLTLSYRHGNWFIID